MAWDTDRTRERLLAAGVRQFAKHGFAGARIDAIGADAGVNKERVYRYFGNKEGLFQAVLASQLAGLLDGLAAHGSGPAAVGTLAGAMFDRCEAQPDLPRLLAWESLELDHAVGIDARRPVCAGVAASIGSATGSDHEAATQALLSIIVVVVSWTTLPRLTDAVAPGTSGAARRAAVVAHATAIGTSLTLDA
ncbi:MAG: TetR/AcrR family transcriptional regulator [Demequina sp.]|uniref:TetR/AcrR family transcriptional regulator n=1 Tax=Demequina sp. TaxID=2050685 RepID=UPI003A8926FD